MIDIILPVALCAFLAGVFVGLYCYCKMHGELMDQIFEAVQRVERNQQRKAKITYEEDES